LLSFVAAVLASLIYQLLSCRKQLNSAADALVMHSDHQALGRVTAAKQQPVSAAPTQQLVAGFVGLEKVSIYAAWLSGLLWGT